jgi:pyrroloquinoline quinone biosynthesis protein B
VAISADGHRWFLLNASPDVRDQLSWLPSAGEPDAMRHVPIEGVLLTDGEVDHSLGLVLLREARQLAVFATLAVREILEKESAFLTVARAFADMPVTDLPLDSPRPLPYRDGTLSGLMVEAFSVPADPPRFAREEHEGHTVGLSVFDAGSGGRLVFAPGCGELTPALVRRFAQADILLFDGTFWRDDEPIRLGISTRSAREMDHVPISGPGGSLDMLADLPCRHRVYTHINNTNPILVEDSPERAAVVAAGLMVGYDGLQLSA